MKRIAFCLAGLMVLSLSSFAHAEETDAEKGLKSFGEYMVGGVWKSERDGKKLTSQYSWLGNKQFIRMSNTTDGTLDDNVMVIGVDPKSKKVYLWGFSSKGLNTSRMTHHENGVWYIAATFTDDNGQKIDWKGKYVRVAQDKIHLDTVELIVDGVKQDPPPVMVSKRHKS